jgi:peptide/nickel transport system substrate-binding protein
MIWRSKRSLRWPGALLIVLQSTLLVCSSAAPAAARADPVLTVALLQDVESLNPFLDISSAAVQIYGLNYDRLTDYRTADNAVIPGLASGWKFTADRKTWTFTIRSGVRWSDGQPLTAADVAFTYTTVMKHPSSVNASQVKTFSSVTAPNPTTVVITTKVPTATMLSIDIPIVPAHVWRDRDPLADLPDTVSSLIGSGPFRLVSARAGQDYRLVRNLEYWRGTPPMNEVVLRYFANSDAAAQALRKGEIDAAGNLTPAQLGALEAEDSVTINEAEGSRFTDLVFNVGAARVDGKEIGDGHPALRDPQVRSAVESAIDRQALVDRVLSGHGEVGEAYFPPSYQPWSWQPGPGVRRDFDPATANRLLDTAGYRRGPDGVRTMPAGGPEPGRALSFRLYAPVERAHYGQSARYLTEWLRDIGIKVAVSELLGGQIGDRVEAGRFDLSLGGWLLDPDPDYQMSIHTCDARPDAKGNGSTNGFTCDRTLDELYVKQAREIDQDQRVKLVHQFQERLYQIAPQIILYYPAVLEGYRSDRVAHLSRRPAATGSLIGAWSYVTAEPAAASSATSPAANSPVDRYGTELFWSLTVVLLATVVVVVLLRRRRSAQAQRE